VKKLTRALVLKLNLNFLAIFSSYTQEINEAYLFSLDYLYPQTFFYRFEAASKELWSDLDLLIAHQDSLAYAVESNYLKTQFLKLHAAAHMLCAHEKESRNYLPEDIEYLLEVIQHIAEKSLVLTQNFPAERSKFKDELYSLLQETNDVLMRLLAKNQEYIES
jgi:hypothetical protein